MSKSRSVEQAMRAAWRESVARCTNPDHRQYRYYGGRGITYCERWLVFENYLADIGLRPTGMTLDRKDNNLGYNPDNCRWATRKQQTNNRRATLKITYQGETRTLPEWEALTGISYWTLKARLRAGYSPRDILTKLVKCGGLLEGRVYKKRKKPDTTNVPRGENHPFAKLSNDEVRDLRSDYATGEVTLQDMAEKYGVCFQAVSQIVNYKTYVNA